MHEIPGMDIGLAWAVKNSVLRRFGLAQFLFRSLEWLPKGFRWLHASGTTIGSYTNGNGTFAALRPVYPGGSNVFVRVSLHVLPLPPGQRRARNIGVSR